MTREPAHQSQFVSCRYPGCTNDPEGVSKAHAKGYCGEQHRSQHECMECWQPIDDHHPGCSVGEHNSRHEPTVESRLQEPSPCHLCGAPRITTGQNVCDGSYPYECGSIIRPGSRAPDVRRVGDQCARWARDVFRAVEVMDLNYRQLAAERDRMLAVVEAAIRFAETQDADGRFDDAGACDAFVDMIDHYRKATDDDA